MDHELHRVPGHTRWAHMHMHTHARANTYTCEHTRMHAHTHTRARAHTYTHMHMLSCTHTHTHSHTHAHTQSRTYTRMHTRAHIQSRTHAHTLAQPMHTHIPPHSCFPGCHLASWPPSTAQHSRVVNHLYPFHTLPPTSPATCPFPPLFLPPLGNAAPPPRLRLLDRDGIASVGDYIMPGDVYMNMQV